jgi:hypothetical protein
MKPADLKSLAVVEIKKKSVILEAIWAPNWILFGSTGPGKPLEGFRGQNQTTFDLIWARIELEF